VPLWKLLELHVPVSICIQVLKAALHLFLSGWWVFSSKYVSTLLKRSSELLRIAEIRRSELQKSASASTLQNLCRSQDNRVVVQVVYSIMLYWCTTQCFCNESNVSAHFSC
jgi:hypothetical protein